MVGERYAIGLEAPAAVAVEKIDYWDPYVPNWVPNPPEIYLGDTGGAYIGFRNYSTQPQHVFARLRIYDPTGKLRVGATRGPYEAFPPDYYHAIWLTLPLDVAGEWTASFWLEVNEVLVDFRENIPIAYVTGPAVPKGRIDTWRLWDWETGSWVAVPPMVVPGNETIGILGRGKNTTNATLEMRMDAKIYSPTGASWTIGGDVLEVPPGLLPTDYPEWEFLWQATELGYWHADLILYARLSGGTDMVEVDRREDIEVAHVAEWVPPPPPKWELLQHTVYPSAYTYYGPAEVCTYTLKLPPEQITPPGWLGDKIANAFASELEKEGRMPVELKVKADTSPIFWTDFEIEVTAAMPTTAGVAIAAPAWPAILLAVIIILGIIVILYFVKKIVEIIWGRKPLPEETKAKFARETLIAMILDLSPETPPETLAAMSDQELRDLLNQLLIEVAPPGIAWWKWALIGGGAVVAIGTAIALARR